ncbi:hypothetical protein LSH36_621g00020 [Paralvinella palmiformis]|uniref:Uncharacterized protein n=1 Tax=Paralvinella palmiformis TaxID=53620 RepID=A0AAD9J4Z9_9ANNE|nr:hypothetical protein LSH36_621g00020 [Paralvinella palmiformis]
MPHDKEHKRKSKKKRQPSFTLPKNPYNYQYGSTRSTAKKKGPLIGTWTRLRSPGKPGQGLKGHDDKVQNRNGFLKLNEKVSHNLNVQEIGSWMQKQKPREVGHIDDALPPADYEDDEQAPESGYITPEQQSSELEYPLPSQHRVAQGTQNSPSGSVSSNQSTPHHVCQSYTTTVQAEVHVSYTEDNRNSLASLGSIPSMPPPPPPKDAMALQMNPLLGSSVKHISMMSASSGSSSGTLHDPCQPDDIYQHYIAPSEDSNGPLHQAAYGGVVASVISNKESNTYETTLPSPGTQTMPNVDNFMNRPLPAPPGGGRQYNTMNHLGQNNMPNSGAATMMANQMGMTLDEFPPPPPQFAGGKAVTSLQHHQTSRPESGPGAHHPRAADPSSNKNSLPFPVKLRPVGSPLLNDSNTDSSTYQYKDTIDVFSVVVPPPSQQSKGAPPPIKPKIRPGDQFPGSVFPSLCANPAAPSSQFPAPPSPISPNEYSEIINELVLPPPPPPPTVGGISADLANRIQEWTISNQGQFVF